MKTAFLVFAVQLVSVILALQAAASVGHLQSMIKLAGVL